MNNSIHFPPELIDELRTTQHVAVLTGAGTSAESSAPTFRDTQTNLWAQYSPEQLASPQPFSIIPNWSGRRIGRNRRRSLLRPDPVPCHLSPDSHSHCYPVETV